MFHPTTRKVTMTRKQYASKFTPEQKAEYHKAQREEASQRLEDAVASLQTSDGFKAWLRARAMFHNYSFNNQLLIIWQKEDATRVASAKVWRELERHIVKGEKAIKVFAPIEWHVECEPGELGAKWNAKRMRFERKVTGFKLVPVFDVAQTDGEPLPHVDVADVDGDSHAHLEPRLVKFAKSLGYKVKTEKLDGGVGGYCDSTRKLIVLGDHQSPNGRIRVLVHEIAHALGIGYEKYGRAHAEVIVESATYIVLSGQGMATDLSSVPYVAGWGNGNGAEAVRDFAGTIDEVASKIESALA
jgi:hypothetical protein